LAGKEKVHDNARKQCIDSFVRLVVAEGKDGSFTLDFIRLAIKKGKITISPNAGAYDLNCIGEAKRIMPILGITKAEMMFNGRVIPLEAQQQKGETMETNNKKSIVTTCGVQLDPNTCEISVEANNKFVTEEGRRVINEGLNKNSNLYKANHAQEDKGK